MSVVISRSLVGSSSSRTLGEPIRIRSRYNRRRSPPERLAINEYWAAGCKEKFFEHLPGGDLRAVGGGHILGDLADIVDHPLLVGQCAALLVVIADMHGLARFDLAAIRLVSAR